MSHRLHVRPEAEQDIAEAAAWYQDQRAGLGQEFLDQVLECFDNIAERPNLYSCTTRDARRALLHRFPFAVHFRVLGDVVLVFAVLHGHRHPRAWKGRLAQDDSLI